MPWKRFFHRSYWDREREQEIAAYVEFETADNIERGMSAEEARYAALRKLGNITRIREEVYNMNSIGFLEALAGFALQRARAPFEPRLYNRRHYLPGIRYRRKHGYFPVARCRASSLLPVKDPQQLVEVSIKNFHHATGNFTDRRSNLTNPQWERIRARQQVFSGVAAWGNKTFNVAPGGEAQNVEGLFISGDFFNVLGVPAVLGR